MVVNSDKEAADGDTVVLVDGVRNSQIEYQISPLEHENRKDITIPHDNMPPYMEVYIWECMEVDENELEPLKPIRESFQIRFDPNGGTPGEIVEVDAEYGMKLGQFLPEVTRHGHRLDGWFTQRVDGKPVFPWTSTYGDATYYARWEPETYVIDFIENGGTPDILSRKVKHGNVLDPVQTISRDGYIFGGWFEKEDNSQYLAGRPYNLGRNATYLARWLAITHTVRFDCNEGTFSDGQTIHARHVNHGSSYAIDEPSPSREGYVFIGWWTRTDGGHPVSGTQVAEGDITYYARWEIMYHTVKFQTNGGSYVSSFSRRHGEEIGNLPVTIKDGYDFQRWELAGSEVEEIMKVYTDLTIDAVWKGKEYTIAYLLNLDSASMPTTARYSYSVDTLNSDYYPPNPSYTTGYELDSWVPQKLPVGSVGNWTFNAKWKYSEYTVTWEYQGGEETESSRTRFYNERLGELPSSSKPKHALAGWFDAPTDGRQVTESEIVKGNVTYYAQWRMGRIVLTLDANGGFLGDGVPETRTYTIGELFGNHSLGNLPTPERTGYNFIRWRDGDGNTVDDSTQAPDEDITAYAEWEPFQYTVVFNRNNDGATGSMANQTMTYDQPASLDKNQFS